MTNIIASLIADLKACHKSDFVAQAAILSAIHSLAPHEFDRARKAAGLNPRKAYALRQIDERFGGNPSRKKRLTRIGWTKLSIMARDNVSGWTVTDMLQLAEQNTAHDLELILRGEVPPDEGRVVVLRLTIAQYEALEEALLVHGAEKTGKGLRRKEEALLAALGVS